MTLFGHAISDITRLWLLYLGLIFVVVMMYMPAGLVSVATTYIRNMYSGNVTSVGRRLLSLLPIAVMTVVAVFVCELANIVRSRDYQTELEKTGQWATVPLFGQLWAPGNLLTWAIPVLILVLMGKL